MKRLSELEKTIYRQWDIINIYKAIVDKYSDSNNSIDLSKEDILNYVLDVNPLFKYYRKERFYGLKESKETYQFIFNFSVKSNFVEPIVYCRSEYNDFEIGGSLINVCRLLRMQDDSPAVDLLPYPVFNTEIEFKKLIGDLYGVYSDMCISVLKSNKS